MLSLIFLIVSLVVVIKSADFAIKYAGNLAGALRLPKYTIGFLIVAVISIMPETFIGIQSAFQGTPSFGLGTLFGSNVADLTLIFAIIIFYAARPIKVGSRVLESNRWYPFILALPILMGFDGYYSRTEGLVLIIAGLIFFIWTFRQSQKISLPATDSHNHFFQNLFFLVVSVVILILGSYFVVRFGVAFAESINISPILIGMLIVGIGTTLPELFFSLRAVKQNGDGLALGDVLGTVVSDATIAVGIMALIRPFSFPIEIVLITAMFMLLASIMLLTFMRSGKAITIREGFILLFFYIIFLVTEYLFSK